MKKLLVLFTFLLFLTLPTAALATFVRPTDSVTINEQELQCVTGESIELTITGTAAYANDWRLIIIDNDGTEIYNANTEPTTWSSNPITFGLGEHTITATVTSTITHEVKATDTWTFTVEKCAVPVATPSTTITELPNTGQNDWLFWIAGLFIAFGVGWIASWTINKK